MTMIRLLLINLSIWGAAAETNFLLIVVDDLRPALGCYGDTNAYTPNIDKLAENSVLFSRAYAQLALCAPSRNSFLTSRRPDTLELYDFSSYWRDAVGNFTTLPEHLKNYGYRTKSVGKIFHPGISSNRTDDCPYSWTEKPFHPFTNRYKNSPVCRGGGNSSLAKNLVRLQKIKVRQFELNGVCPVEVGAMPGGTLPDLETLEVAKEFIENRSKDPKPFFLAVGFHKPHIPLKYPHKYLKYHPLSKFKIAEPYEWPGNVSSVAYNPWSDLRKRSDVKKLILKFPWEKIPVDFGKKIVQSYYAAVTYIDDLIGILLSQLRVSSLHENTVVALTSDHGWSLGEHAEWAKYSNFEVAVRVPLIISIPRNLLRATVTNIGRSDFSYPIPKNVEASDEKKKSRSLRQTFREVLRVIKDLKRPDQKSIVKSECGSSAETANVCVDAMVELVDIFPTIAELAGHPIPICPDTREKRDNQREATFSSPSACTEGISLTPLIRASLEDKSLPWKKGAFSQYPRPGLEPTLHPNSDKPRLRDINIMGYSLRTQRFRYTEWANFSSRTKKPDWRSIVAEELYDHSVDPGENSNVAASPVFHAVKAELRTLLRGGWREALPNRVNLEN